MGVGHMDGRGEIEVEGLHPGEGERIDRRQLFRRRERGDIGQDGRAFSQDSLIGRQGRDTTLGIEGQKFRLPLVGAPITVRTKES